MPRTDMARHILTVFLAVTLAACKFTVIVPRGGVVLSTASGTCEELTNCIHDIVDTTYTESFRAVPQEGFQFVRWNTGGNFVCKDSINPTCVIDTTPLAGIIPDETIAGFGDYYIMPIFGDKLPITDTVIADGKEWAQVNLFTNKEYALVPSYLWTRLSWSAIDAICPSSGGGVCNGSLNGWDMTGWTWASVDEVNSLFNSYGVEPPLGTGPDRVDVICELVDWSANMADDGWELANLTSPWTVSGFTRTSQSSSAAYVGTWADKPSSILACNQFPNLATVSVVTNTIVSKDSLSDVTGGWFYRTP
jgi:hypothetical protein